MQGKTLNFSTKTKCYKCYIYIIYISISKVILAILSLSFLSFLSFWGCGEDLDLNLGNKPKPMAHAIAPPPTNLSWSPDGKWILYLAEATIKIMKTDESHQVQTLTGIGQYDNPIWSPKGEQIAYDLASDFGLPDIWVKDVFKKSVPISVTTDFFYDSNPTWSADGKKIVFQSQRSGNWDIWIANATRASALIQLTTDPKSDESPLWSPDGGQIAFESERTGTSEIWLASPNQDKPERQFTFDSRQNYGAKWSPDSSKIAYFSFKSGATRILIKSADGSGSPTDIGVSDAVNYTWTPNGAFIVYESGGKILAKSIKSVEAVQTPIYVANGLNPAISSDGMKLAYVQFEPLTSSFSIKIMDTPAEIGQ